MPSLFPRLPHTRDRGSILLVTVVLMLVLLVIGLGLVVRGQKSYGAVAQKQHYDASVSCADGARQMLLSQFRAFNVDPTGLTLNSVVNDRLYTTGHYDTFNIKSVQGNGATSFGGLQARGLANTIGTAGTGGTPYEITVVCSDTTGQSRQTEVEFFLRFGI